MSFDKHELSAKRVLCRLEQSQGVAFVSTRGASALASSAAHVLLRFEHERGRASAFAAWLIEQVEVAELFVDDDELEALLVAEWDDDGTRRPAIVARSEALEAQLLARPDDPELHQVYGDWLQAQGDAYGELIVRSVAAAQSGHSGLARQVDDYLELHASKLLGPLAEYLDSVVSLDWQLGFIRRARLIRDVDHGESYEGAILLRWLLEQRASLLLRSLSLESLTLGRSNQLGEMLAELARRPPALLERLRIGDGEGGELAPLFDALPGLLELSLPSRYLGQGPLGFAELRSLTVELNWQASELAPLWSSSLARLEQLRLRRRELNEELPSALFDASLFPALRELEVPGSWTVLERLARSELLSRLEVLDLSHGSLDEAAIEQLVLPNAGRFCRLRRLLLDDNHLGLRAGDLVVGALAPVDVSIGEQSVELADDDDYYEDVME